MIISPVVMTLSLVVAAQTFSTSSMPPDYWRNPRRCGPNCLYAYLSLCGKTTSIASIVPKVPIGPDGANMADLRKAADELGVASQVIKTVPADLGDHPTPMIAHMNSREGHFVIVLQVSDGFVTTADMIHGGVDTVPADLFFATWSGYLLVPEGKKFDWRLPLLAVLTITSAGFFLAQKRVTDASMGATK